MALESASFGRLVSLKLPAGPGVLLQAKGADAQELFVAGEVDFGFEGSSWSVNEAERSGVVFAMPREPRHCCLTFAYQTAEVVRSEWRSFE